jgi:serine/threonine protein kinase
MTISTLEFSQRLEQSGILSPQALEELKKTVSGEVTLAVGELSRRLVGKGTITGYQADALQAETPGPVRLGEYVISERIGEGGMGVVYKARRQGHNRLVALKLLPPELMRNADAVRRFRREVEAASSLSHPHIVAALDSGEDSGSHFYVMEYVPGDDLADLVKAHGPLPVGTAVNCILHAAQGLQHAHAHGVTHRDVKPSNLLLDRQGNVRVLDLGLARISRDTDAAENAATRSALTQTGAVLGTVDYMSPEQALNTRKADHRSDVYSLGCTLGFLLTGKPPYQGETVMEVLVAHREQPIPSLRAVRDDVPVRLDEFYRKCLAKKADERYQSMAELVTELGSCKGEHEMTWIIQRIVSRRRTT